MLNCMKTEQGVGSVLPANPQEMTIEAKRALVLIYGQTDGADPLGARRLPDIVHWLQRASSLYAERCVQAREG